MIDLRQFDKRIHLTAKEAGAITAIARNVRDWRIFAEMRPAIERLYAPLEFTRQYIANNTGEKQLERYRLINIVVAMGEKRKSFWGWQNSDWQEMMSKEKGSGHQMPAAIAYLLCGLQIRTARTAIDALCDKVFGAAVVDHARKIIRAQLVEWGYKSGSMKGPLYMLNRLLLVNRSSVLEDLSARIVRQVYEEEQSDSNRRRAVIVLSKILNALGIIDVCIVPPSSQGHRSLESLMRNCRRQDVARAHDISPGWLRWSWRWYQTSTLTKRTRIGHYGKLRQLGRWLKQQHPKVTSPTLWDRKLAAAFVAAVNGWHVGDYSSARYHRRQDHSGPLSPTSKHHTLSSIRVFFKDCQEWEWIPRRFNPEMAFRVPTAVKRAIEPNPRAISDPIWAKLLWAALNLKAEDVPDRKTGEDYYPFELVRALAIVWLFAGLRRNEICRLRRSCVRWDAVSPQNANQSQDVRICFLKVPLSKHGPGFEKPVDEVVGEAIERWERIQPAQPRLLDQRTGEMTHLLFAFRGMRLGPLYINKRLVPMLCAKAGVPQQDNLGRITSHRARSTIATQLYHAKEGMSLFELQEWLGHRCPSSTKHYLKLQPTKLANSFLKADYFRRNVRMVEVLIDAEAVRSGLSASGNPWKFYDLGHGYCSYDFFEQCPHRMACAKCDYYLPKQSSKAHFLEAKANLLRMRQEIPLTPEELAAVEDGLEAMKSLYERLTNVRTPSGQTPAQLIQIETSIP